MAFPASSAERDPLPALHGLDEILKLCVGNVVSGRTIEETRCLRDVAAWSIDYLTNPHADLGRRGPVCPWVRSTIQNQGLFLTIISGHDAERAQRILGALRHRFLEMETAWGKNDPFKTIVVVFPDISDGHAPVSIQSLHRLLKPTFVAHGLMLGEFYPTCESPGLHNPRFRPLRSPVSLLVIRYMVEADIVFLRDSEHFLRAYLKHFPRGGRGRFAIS